MITSRENVVGMDASILMHPNVWEASGHVDNFHDPLIDNKISKKRYRVDHLLELQDESIIHALLKELELKKGENNEDTILSIVANLIDKKELSSHIMNACEVVDPEIKKPGDWTEVRQFNLMFKTNIGPVQDSSSIAYLRPETAQGIFVNFQNVQTTSRQKLPFVTEILTQKNMSEFGAYEIRKNNPNPEIILISSGSEVQIAIDAFSKLKNLNINAKVVSMPCQELFDEQTKEYKEKILEKNAVKISIEAGSIFGWEKYIGQKGASVGMKSFGKSAPIKDLYENFNLTSNNIVKLAKIILGK